MLKEPLGTSDGTLVEKCCPRVSEPWNASLPADIFHHHPLPNFNKPWIPHLPADIFKPPPPSQFQLHPTASKISQFSCIMEVRGGKSPQWGTEQRSKPSLVYPRCKKMYVYSSLLWGWDGYTQHFQIKMFS